MKVDTSSLEVKVYMDFVNYESEITESTLIAAFRNRQWAENFINQAKEHEDAVTRIRVEEE